MTNNNYLMSVSQNESKVDYMLFDKKMHSEYSKPEHLKKVNYLIICITSLLVPNRSLSNSTNYKKNLTSQSAQEKLLHNYYD
jgi:hypothetical protein